MRIDEQRLFSHARPTARERWLCFCRLYRLARKVDEQNNQASNSAVDALRMIGYWNWCAALAERDPPGDRRHYPLFLRREFLRLAKRRRLYGPSLEHYEELLPKDQAIARVFAEERGIELTIDEAADERNRLFRKIRQHMRDCGSPMPEGDGSDVYVHRTLRELRRRS